jgi:hypothetical protein
MPSDRADALDALRPRSFGSLPGLVDEFLVAVLGLFELFRVALPKLRGTFLDGFSASRLGLLQFEGVARAGLPQLFFVLRDFLRLAPAGNIRSVRQFGEAP